MRYEIDLERLSREHPDVFEFIFANPRPWEIFDAFDVLCETVEAGRVRGDSDESIREHFEGFAFDWMSRNGRYPHNPGRWMQYARVMAEWAFEAVDCGPTRQAGAT